MICRIKLLYFLLNQTQSVPFQGAAIAQSIWTRGSGLVHDPLGQSVWSVDQGRELLAGEEPVYLLGTAMVPLSRTLKLQPLGAPGTGQTSCSDTSLNGCVFVHGSVFWSRVKKKKKKLLKKEFIQCMSSFQCFEFYTHHFQKT